MNSEENQFTEFDIMIRREYLFKLKIRKVFGNKKCLNNMMSKFMKLILIFIRIIKKNKS